MTAPTRAERASAAFSFVGLTALIVALHLVGRGSGTRPPVHSLSAFEGWLQTAEPVALGFTVVRLVSLAIAYHLLLVISVSLLGRALRRPKLLRSAERMTLPPVRALARRMAGLGMSAAALAGTAARVEAATAVAPFAEPMSTATLWIPAPDEGQATLSVVVDELPSTPAEPVPQHGAHVVEPGDHLWSIAEDELSRHLGHPPKIDVVERYWNQLILANPDLVDPDLVFPGDVITLPPPRHTG